MNWRLGLDLGTNSIGWSVFSIDKNKEIEELLDLGVRIFSDGRNPKTKEPLAVERRTARGQRKIIYRRKLRRRATFRLLQKEGLIPNSKEEALALKLLNPYELRVSALERKLERNELGRVLFNRSVRRGFKSNRKDNSNQETSDKESKSTNLSQKDMQNNLLKAIKDSKCRTLGEYLYKNQDSNGGIRFSPGRMSYYPTRQMYIDEFNAIKNFQLEFYPNLNWNSIFDSIFFQRPLKKQLRGKCLYEPEHERTFKAMPCAQILRILQDVRNLVYFDELGKKQPLTDEQDETLIKLLNSKEKVTFDDIRKKLSLKPECSFNLESPSRQYLLGNSTAVKMRSKNRFGDIWDTFSLEEQDTIVELLITADEDQEVLDLLNKYNLSAEQTNKIVSLILSPGTTSLCKEVSEQLVKKMLNLGTACNYTSAVQALGYKYASQDIEQTDLLEYYGKILTGSTVGGDLSAPETKPEKKYGKISNPTVHVALNQTRVIVNALIKKYGKPTQIAIELSRELKASREAKANIIKQQNENRKRNELINNNLQDGFKIEYPNRTQRLKYRLWEELGSDSLSRRCIYCGKVISAAELFSSESKIEIEHILPYSRTLLDAESNLTIAHASCNAYKKERSPFEAFGQSADGYNWLDIIRRSDLLHNKAKRNRFSETAMEEFEQNSNFISRQLTDNAYLSRTAYKYLHSICNDIWTVNGGMTKLLRDKWEIDSILKGKITEKEIAMYGLKPELVGEYRKNRYDHRHHAMDAVVIALTDRSLVKQISELNARSMKNRIEVPPFPILRNEFQDKVRNIVVSFKPDHGREGKLSKETLLGKIKREERINIKDLQINDIPAIKTERVRIEIQTSFDELKDIKKVQKAFAEIYPQIIIFKEYYVSRTPVISLKENNIQDIVDEKIKEKLIDFIAKEKGKKFEEIMQDFAAKEWTGKANKGKGKKYHITKVRCLNRVQTPIEVKGKVNRYLAPDDYFAAVIWEMPPKKDGAKCTFEAQYLRRDQIAENNQPKKEVIDLWKNKDARAKKICVLHKNDYLEFSKDGNFYKCRIAGFSATQNKVDIRPIYAVTDCSDWLQTTAHTMTEPCWKNQKNQNFISVNILFSTMEAKAITVSPIGIVSRK